MISTAATAAPMISGVRFLEPPGGGGGPDGCHCGWGVGGPGAPVVGGGGGGGA
jgi:hypothetical protein